MDASLATGIASLAIQLFSGSLSSYRALVTAFTQDISLEILRCKLELEEQRFMLWGDASRISQEQLGFPGAHIASILNSLQAISNLISEARTLAERNAVHLATQETATNVPSNESRSVQVASSVTRTARWVLDDKARLESIIRDLKDFNDSLNSLLYHNDRLELGKSFQKVCIETLSTETQRKLEILEQSNLEDYRDLAFMAALRRAGLQLEGLNTGEQVDLGLRSSDGTSGFEARWIIDVPELHSRAPGDTMLCVNGESLHLEWKKLPDVGSPARHRVIQRLQFLMNILGKSPKPADFCVLDLRGFAVHPDQAYVALAYSIPPTVVADSRFSLQELLTLKELRKAYRPPLEGRVRLALRLCRCVLMLHTAGWLHKAIRPSNVMFFPPEYGASIGALDSAYLIGFESAREDELAFTSDTVFTETLSTETEWQYYEHPLRQGEQKRKFSKVFDIYSLGLVLLDIALWNPFTASLEGVEPTKAKSFVLKHLLQGEVAFRVGSIYEDVIRQCITGNLYNVRGVTKNWREVAFWNNVIQKLELCNA
ncbi:hypothetical protein LTR84_010437 [Exophiala bonariae]|uniref:Protein kinase domain-containing protein n=1 Tax=Exophiala bonariae TaxID=1690606 RepID=A0AAV9MW54_9EURO|nr:hypothetical protein LTR84_010437 [Exophiala bonariae]